MVGDIGAGKSKRLTAIGDSMNFSSRVESANKQFESRLLISEEVHEEIKDVLVVKDFMRTNLPGIDGRVTLFEIEDINLSNEEKLENQIIEETVTWNKGPKLKIFDESPQQVVKIKEKIF